MLLPQTLQSLIDELCKLPGVGPKTALRYLFYLLNLPKNELELLAEKIKNLKNFIKTCSVCFNFSSDDPCVICRDKSRDKSLLCVVATSQDLNIIEGTGEFKGVYHVLGGVLNPLEGIMADRLRIKELLSRIEPASPTRFAEAPVRREPGEGGKNGIKEVILALNPDMQGETTMLYLNKIIKSPTPSLPLKKGEGKGGGIKVTRLARGLPVGATVEYADEVTLSDALKDRKEM